MDNLPKWREWQQILKTTGSDMEWQEFYLLNGTFKKI
jgi:hypothetical protein